MILDVKILTIEERKERIEKTRSDINSMVNNLVYLDEIGHPHLSWYMSAAEVNVDMMERLIKIEEEKIKSIQN